VLFSVARPVWELRGFKRVTLAPGASETLTFTLTEKELGFWNREQEYVVEPGQFVVGFDNHFSNEGLRKRAVTYVVKEPERPEAREKVLFDTDIGGDPDDGLALQYLLLEPRCELLGITTVCDRPERRARIASALCRSLGRADVPIHAGAALPFLSGRNLATSAAPKPCEQNRRSRLPEEGSMLPLLRRRIPGTSGSTSTSLGLREATVSAAISTIGPALEVMPGWVPLCCCCLQETASAAAAAKTIRSNR
jgi:hypothetical protein